MNTDLFDVVLIGYGPVGQAMAALLGQQGHSVAVFERQPALYGFARAGHIDHEIMRILQSIGIADAFSKVSFATSEYELLSADGKVLLHLSGSGESPSGWPPDLIMYQPDLEDLLHQAVQSHPSVEIHYGWEGYALTQHDDHVEVTVREGKKGEQGQWTPTGEMRTVRARYVIGADGANSFVRRTLGIDWEDLGFEENWLVIDYRPDDLEARIDMPVMAQICDPARPTTVGHQQGSYCRWEFMLLPGEKPEEMAAPAKVWELLSRWVKPADGHLLRHVVYTFRSTLAEQWRKGRVLLAGDSAHLMPPFLGQGLCSGIRDAKNLAWKLDLILQGNADTSLLDTYSIERRPHVRSIIEQAVMLGRIICITDPTLAAARDQAFLAGVVPPPPAFPGLADGILHRDAAGVPISPAGQLSLQGRVSYQGRTGRFDDLVGQGWVLMSLSTDPRSVLNAQQLAFLDKLGTKIVQVRAAGEKGEHEVVDIDGDYTRFFAQGGFEAILTRPDFYIFGCAPSLRDLATLVDELQTQIVDSQSTADVIA
jgi:2-polyprenyl-6-methoxyphenol hydroxylase-like FAD-dependent oxidoreductase